VTQPLKTLFGWLVTNFHGPLPASMGTIHLREVFAAFMISARPGAALGGVDNPVKQSLVDAAKSLCVTLQEIMGTLKEQVMLPTEAVKHLVIRAIGDFGEFLDVHAIQFRMDVVKQWRDANRALVSLRRDYMLVTSGPHDEMDYLLNMVRVMTLIAYYEHKFPHINFQEENNAGTEQPDYNNLIPY
jgi:hypothetical protein